MVNSVMLVGRLTGDIEIKELENGHKVSNVTLAVHRPYKDENGEYKTDFFDCTLWHGIAQNAAEYCRKGDTVGIRGRLENDSWEKDGEKKTRMNIVVEKLTFISSKKIETPELSDDEEKSTDKVTKKAAKER